MSSPPTPSIVLEQISLNSMLCSIDECRTLYDVHCFHCRTNLCSDHYHQHQEKRLKEENWDDTMDHLLKLTSSKCFSISSSSRLSKMRRKSFNPFVSSKYLMKKMKENLQSKSIGKKKFHSTYNLRKRPRQYLKKPTENKSVKLCQTLLKSRLKFPKLCHRPLPCPYHSIP